VVILTGSPQTGPEAVATPQPDDDGSSAMGRKRLLTILATVAAAVALQAGPASAQLLDDTVNLGSDDGCLEVGVDISLSDALKADSSTCITEGGVEVKAETLQQKVDTKKTTTKVEETTSKVTETAKQESPAPAPEKAPAPKPDTGGTTGGGSPASDGGGTTSSDGSAPSSDVAASGEVREPQAAATDPNRQRHLGTLLAIRDDLAAGSPAARGVAGPVQPFGDLATTDDLAAPQVADAAAVTPGIESPEVAPGSEAAEEAALFASTTPMRDLAEAPVALQLLAAALVLGAAAVWTLAAREFGVGEQTTSA
jgi:hypothetical protein